MDIGFTRRHLHRQKYPNTFSNLTNIISTSKGLQTISLGKSQKSSDETLIDDNEEEPVSFYKAFQGNYPNCTLINDSNQQSDYSILHDSNEQFDNQDLIVQFQKGINDILSLRRTYVGEKQDINNQIVLLIDI
jgi:hypothetical protein